MTETTTANHLRTTASPAIIADICEAILARQRFLLTSHARPDGDTHLPAVDPTAWEEVARVRNPAGPDNSADFSYVTYRRRQRR